MTSSGCSFSTSFSNTRAAVERLDGGVGLDVQGAVGAHGERGAQLLLAVSRADGGDDDFLGAAALLDAQGLFERDLVEGVDAHLDAVGDDARAVRLDADAHVVVHDALDADQDSFHRGGDYRRR